MNEMFWMVWNPEGNMPRVRHETESLALKEASRLALLNRGQQFYVLAATDRVQVEQVQRTRLEPPVPF